jgi:hypothetical protein
VIGQRHLFAASALWGVAFGLVAYRYGVLPFVWASNMKFIVPGIAAGTFMGGLQLLRQRPRATTRRSEPYPIIAMFGLFAAGFALAFGVMYIAFPSLDRASLTKRALPGFSLALPSGEKTEQVAYVTGNVTLKRVGDGTGVVIVEWEPGTALSSDELRQMVPVFAKLITKNAGTTKVIAIRGPDRKPLDTLLFETDHVDLELTSLSCGVRHVLVATAATSGLARLHQRIISSFQCHPDAAQEAQSGELPFPLKLDLPGWHVVSKDSEVTQIAHDSASMILRTLAPTPQTPNLAEFISMTFEQMGAHVTILEKNDDFIKVYLQDKDPTATGWIALVKCPQAFALVLALVQSDAAGTELYARVKVARCLQPGEAPVQFPEQ